MGAHNRELCQRAKVERTLTLIRLSNGRRPPKMIRAPFAVLGTLASTLTIDRLIFLGGVWMARFELSIERERERERDRARERERVGASERARESARAREIETERERARARARERESARERERERASEKARARERESARARARETWHPLQKEPFAY